MERRTQPPPPAEMEGGTQPPPAEMEGETQPPPLPACVSKVLNDDNLLTEIIVRVGFPTSLVRAAAVCRRWLQLASDRAFLRRFRKLHPPSLLGFYLDWSFFPLLSQPPPSELAAVVGRANFKLDFYDGARTTMVRCWNGRVVTSLFKYHRSPENDSGHDMIFVVHSPLCSERGMAVIPALYLPFQEEGTFCTCRKLFSKEEDGAMSYFYVIGNSTMEGKSVVQVFTLRDGDDSWSTLLTLTVDYLIYTLYSPTGMLIDKKIYVATKGNEIGVLDLTDSSVSTIQPPQGVDFLAPGTTMLSRADEASAVYLIHVKELQLHIWLHKGGNWLLVDNICLREMCAPFLEDDPTALLMINHVGDYTAEFLFLEMGRFALYLDVKCRTLHKVYETTEEDPYMGTIYPFMMVWPPIFPVLKDGPASIAT